MLIHRLRRYLRSLHRNWRIANPPRAYRPTVEVLEVRLALHHNPSPLAFDNIQAFVYVDGNANGRPDVGEQRVSGVSITLNVDGSDRLTLQTDAKGRAWFGPSWGSFSPIRITMHPTADTGDGIPYHHPALSPDYVTANVNSFTFLNNRPFRESQIIQDSHSDFNLDTFLGGEGFYFGVGGNDLSIDAAKGVRWSEEPAHRQAPLAKDRYRILYDYVLSKDASAAPKGQFFWAKEIGDPAALKKDNWEQFTLGPASILFSLSSNKSGQHPEKELAIWKQPPEKAVDILFVLDPKNEILETNENNNFSVLKLHSAAELMDKAITKENIATDGPKIETFFQPCDNTCPLSEAEVRFGVDHFNWEQWVTVPRNWEPRTLVNLNYSRLGEGSTTDDVLGITSINNGSLITYKDNSEVINPQYKISAKFLDSIVLSGLNDTTTRGFVVNQANKQQAFVWRLDQVLQNGTLAWLADAYPYYLNEADSRFDDLHKPANLNAYTLRFYDEARQPDWAFSSSPEPYLQFETRLVGVGHSGSSELVSIQGGKNHANGFTWTSNATVKAGGGAGGVAPVKFGRVPPDAVGGDVTGGVSGVGLETYNSPPTANAGGPYSVNENGAVALNASATTDPDQDPASLTYEWDFDGDDKFGEKGSTNAPYGDEVGMFPKHNAIGLAVGSSRVVSLRVTDALGAISSSTANLLVTPTMLSIAGVGQKEGAAGQTSFDFAIVLSQACIVPVTVDFTTIDGTATLADKDYKLSRGTVTFAPGETAKTITVIVNSDLKAEDDETFSLILVNPANAELPVTMHQVIGRIEDDDSGGTNFYINDASTIGDVYTTAIGSNANDGKSPARPMASLSALLTLYPALQPGDTIYVDSGYYNVSKNIALTPQLSGIRIIGPEQSELLKKADGSEILASQPVAYWRLGNAINGRVPDSTANGLDLTLGAGGTVGSEGISVDGAMYASGQGVAATAPDSSLLRPTSAVSLEAWINPETDGGNFSWIAGISASSGYGFLSVYGRLQFYLNGGSVETSLLRGVWSHVVGTYDGTTIRLFVNGTLAVSVSYAGPYSGTIIYNGNPGTTITLAEFGRYQGGFDELAVYNRALAAAEVAAHYAAVAYSGAVFDRRNSTPGARVFEFQGADDVTIGNLSIAGAESGLYAAKGVDSDRITLFNLDVYGNEQGGIDFSTSSDELRLLDSRIHGNGGAGVPGVTYVGSFGLIMGNVLDLNGGGIFLDRIFNPLASSGGYVTIQNNTVTRSRSYGIEVSGAGVKVVGNSVSGGMGEGIHASASGTAVGKFAVVIEDNDVFGNDVGISDYFPVGQIVFKENRVHNNTRSGIQLMRATAFNNEVFANGIGIDSGSYNAIFSSPTIEGNYVYGNMTEGIRAGTGTTVKGNTVHSNPIGISGRAFPYIGASFTGTVLENIVFSNSTVGVLIAGGNGAIVKNNTVLATQGDAVRITYEDYAGSRVVSRNINVQSNILEVGAGYGIYVANESQPGFKSDYNDLLTGPGGHVGYFGTAFDTLVDWSLELNLDRHSLAVDPKFVNPAGADGVTGYIATTGYDGGLDNDFRLRSDSPLIDSGDPESEYSAEPVPNGGRIDLGAYGGTSEATGKNTRISLRLPEGGLQLSEGWSRQSFPLVLTQPPTGNVEVRLLADSQLILNATSVTFTSADWNVPRMITVSATDNSAGTGLAAAIVNFQVVSADPAFNQANVPQLVANIEEDDPSSWQNPLDPLDVDANTKITPNDVLEVINYINAFGSRSLATISVAVAPPPYLDTSGDYFISPIDALNVIDYINSNPKSGGGGEGEDGDTATKLTVAPQPRMTAPPLEKTRTSLDDLIALLAADAESALPRRKK